MTIVTNGNAFSNIALTRLFDELEGRVDFQVITTTGLRKSKGNRFVEAWKLMRRWGWRYTSYKVATYVVPFLRQLVTRRPHFVARTCRERGIPCENFRSVNTKAARARIAEFGPDLLVSYSCPYRIYPKALALPRIGCLNVHSSLLPKYAGVCTYVHVLADGETETGVTVHEMVEEFDAGRVVGQEMVGIEPGVSVCRLFIELCHRAGPLLAEAVLGCLDTGRVDGEKQNAESRSYCGEPQADDIRRLRANRFTLARMKDFSSF